MKQSTRTLLLLALLVALLVLGALLYQSLSGTPGAPAAETQNTDRNESTQNGAEATPTDMPAAETPAVELAADFTVQDEDGNAVSLSDFVGKPVVVNFWASWCPPCRNELPYFEKASQTYGDEVVFMMVNLTDGGRDTVESATAFMREENGYTFPLYFDVDFSGVQAYAVNAIPVTLFIRADGSLMHQQIGGMSEEMLERYVEQLLT